MAVRIINNLEAQIYVGSPVNGSLARRETKDFQYLAYDDVINTEEVARIINAEYITVINLDDLGGASFVSEWDQEPKLRLGTYTFWVDATNSLRMVNGTPSNDLDGVIIGPGSGGAVPAHGHNHVFLGTDPIPRIEVLEGEWNCTVAEQIGDVVFESAADTVRQANAASTATMPAVGVIILKPTATTCIIAKAGEVALFAGLMVGQEYYVSETTPGDITQDIPTGSGEVVHYVGKAKNTTTLLIDLGQPTVRA